MASEANVVSLIYEGAERSQVQAAMDEAEKRRGDGIEIGGRRYLSVKERVDIFRRFFAFDLSLVTEVVCPDPFVKKGSPVKAVCYIKDVTTGALLATGTAMEYAGSSTYTTTSPFEVAETSAIGRALAALGLHGGEFASANEVVQAKSSNPSLPTIGAVADNDNLPNDRDELLQHVTEKLAAITEISQLMVFLEQVSMHLERIAPGTDLAEFNLLFAARFTDLQATQLAGE